MSELVDKWMNVQSHDMSRFPIAITVEKIERKMNKNREVEVGGNVELSWISEGT